MHDAFCLCGWNLRKCNTSQTTSGVTWCEASSTARFQLTQNDNQHASLPRSHRKQGNGKGEGAANPASVWVVGCGQKKKRTTKIDKTATSINNDDGNPRGQRQDRQVRSKKEGGWLSVRARVRMVVFICGGMFGQMLSSCPSLSLGERGSAPKPKNKEKTERERERECVCVCECVCECEGGTKRKKKQTRTSEAKGCKKGRGGKRRERARNKTKLHGSDLEEGCSARAHALVEVRL